MIDLTDFKKYKFIYLAVILSATLLIALRGAPLYREVFVDIAVEPPDSARRTDFSWITVNEWFVTQIRLITSDTILGNVKSDIKKEKLKYIVSAHRLGASNIIRISVFSDEKPERLKQLASDIAGLYLEQLNNPAGQAGKPAGPSQADRKKTYDAIATGRSKIEEEISAADKRLRRDETELQSLTAKETRSKGVKERALEIDRMIIQLKVELTRLKASYTDGWPAVSKVRKQIDTLETERQKLGPGLDAAQALEEKIAVLAGNAATAKKDIEALRSELKETEGRLARMEREETAALQTRQENLKKTKGSGRIITAPTQGMQRLSAALGIRLLIAIVAGIIFWFLLKLIFKNAYLYWVWKDRIRDIFFK